MFALAAATAPAISNPSKVIGIIPVRAFIFPGCTVPDDLSTSYLSLYVLCAVALLKVGLLSELPKAEAKKGFIVTGALRLPEKVFKLKLEVSIKK